MKIKFEYLTSLFFVAAAVLGTTMITGSNQAWAVLIEGTDMNEFIVGTPGDDIINSKEGDDENFGDILDGDGFGDDVIFSGDGNDFNVGDTA